MIAISKLGFGYEKRAVYAANPLRSLGRIYPENKSLTRSEFQRDRDRLIHTTAFRRLKDKTQVFFDQNRDHYRTRLMHTIEVSQIARSLARALKLDEDLAEGIALAHDFGHPPFGHAGENVLHDLLSFCGGFNHNIQSFRIVTELEHSYADFDGINLTWETLEGLIGHNGPVLDKDSEETKSFPRIFFDNYEVHGLSLSNFASLESQIAAIADDIAYDAHDIDDSLRANLLTFDMLEEVSFLKKHIAELRDLYPDLDKKRIAHEIVRRQITAMVEDVIDVAQDRLSVLKPSSIDDIRGSGCRIIDFSEGMSVIDRQIKYMLRSRVYTHPSIVVARSKVENIVREIFNAYMSNPQAMGDCCNSMDDFTSMSDSVKARRIGDYIAGMTDSYALRAYHSLFGVIPDLPWINF
ncbi:deoxyguanosinetriphosphate triphosphohydrolase [Candidatus Liberibacter americanus]|uniref:deoxyguanosinetriphosphate triphosphohydrolase n=1 Tax=Candidatus Liberibacter americanus TaxID=309868 RepID=UPI0002C6016C|nr:deoxyguanosinetriphosphate triphosphohydrolase [Candidatus Liberibacter americanus]EMS36275.1 deoxyguanosinetriphosphate triphosphohydrolase-like protein [Candidatus Liberibacter americanus PW_SP]